jgi:hypothetical protein
VWADKDEGGFQRRVPGGLGVSPRKGSPKEGERTKPRKFTYKEKGTTFLLSLLSRGTPGARLARASFALARFHKGILPTPLGLVNSSAFVYGI